MRIRARVAYDGAPFHGFAQNEGVRTVAGDLNAALSRYAGSQVTVTCAGRTDRGVHAVGQVVSFDLPDGVDLAGMQRSVNRQCGPAVAMYDPEPVDAGFDARFSAVGRTYRYRILNRVDPDPFLAPVSWHVPDPLDVPEMAVAASAFLGEHDFTSFCRRPSGGQPASLVRRVDSAVWEGPDGEGLLVFEVGASAFCHQMVRSVVGTLVAVGRGRMQASAVPAVLAARDRHAAGEPAPPHGLVLWQVAYPESG